MSNNLDSLRVSYRNSTSQRQGSINTNTRGHMTTGNGFPNSKGDVMMNQDLFDHTQSKQLTRPKRHKTPGTNKSNR